MRDFNAKISANNSRYKTYDGQAWTGENEQDRGALLAYFCAFNNVVISWQYLPSQGYPQGHLVVPWPCHRKPYRPCVHWANVQTVATGRKSKESWYSSRDIVANWKHATQMLTTTCEEVVGRKTAQHKECIIPATLQSIRIRKGKNAALNNSQSGQQRQQPKKSTAKLTQRWREV